MDMAVVKIDNLSIDELNDWMVRYNPCISRCAKNCKFIDLKLYFELQFKEVVKMMLFYLNITLGLSKVN